MRVLPHSIVSLVHYVELNQAGWFEETIDRFALAALWLQQDAAPMQQLKKRIRNELQFEVKAQQLRESLARLEKEGDIVKLADGRFRLGQIKKRELDDHVSKAKELETGVQAMFCQEVAKECPGLDPTQVWTSFIEGFLVPLVVNEGAKAYEMFMSRRKRTPWLSFADKFLAQIPSDHKDRVGSVLRAFLSVDHPDIERFLLSYLDAYFLLAASGLPPSVIRTMIEVRKHPIEFDIFVDTNFVFSMLGLHENPANEAARDLMELVESTSGALHVQFFIKDSTLQETRNSIRYHKRKLLNVPYPPNLAEATSALEISGVIKAFLERVRESGQSITPEEYFRPYEGNLVRLLAEKGIKVYPESEGRKYEQTLEVIDDIENQMVWEAKRYSNRAKTKHQITHDVILWHFVQDLRDWTVGLPLEAKWWVVTVDERFLRWDRYKVKHSDLLPVCMHPAQLAQMLRFFVPRSPQLQAAMLGAMRLHILSREFDINAERISIRIANRLVRHEGIEDISVDTLEKVLTDEGLRISLMDNPGTQEEDELIDSTLAKELKQQQVIIEEKDREIREMERDIEVKNQQILDLVRNIQDLEAQQESTAIKAEQETTKLREELDRLKDDIERRHERNSRMLRWLLGVAVAALGIGAILLPSYLNWQWLVTHPHRLGIQLAASAALLGVFWIIVDTNDARRRWAIGTIIVGSLMTIIKMI